MVKLSGLLAQDCISMERRLQRWSSDLKAKLRAVHREVGLRWKAESVKRVPVDMGFLRNKILNNVYTENQYIYVTEVGTNVPEYPIYLEFGTKYIAQGAVLRLGTSTDITDQQAVHTWPAKQEDEIALTSYSINSKGQLFNNPHKFTHSIVAGPQEQMPWLRPAFNHIKVWVVDSLNQSFEIPPTTAP